VILGLGPNETPWFVYLLVVLGVVGSIVWMWIEFHYLSKAFNAVRRGALRRLFHWYR